MIQKQTKLFFLSLLVLDIVFVSGFFMLYSYMNNEVAETIQNTDEIKTEIKKQETLSLMKTDIDTAKAYQSTLNSFFVQKGDDVSFIKIIEGLAASSSVKLQVNSVNDQPSDAVASVHAELLHININVTGEWKNVQFFLQLLENYPLKISINTLQLSKFSDYQVQGKSVPQWSGVFDFTVVKLQ